MDCFSKLKGYPLLNSGLKFLVWGGEESVWIFVKTKAFCILFYTIIIRFVITLSKIISTDFSLHIILKRHA